MFRNELSKDFFVAVSFWSMGGNCVKKLLFRLYSDLIRLRSIRFDREWSMKNRWFQINFVSLTTRMMKIIKEDQRYFWFSQMITERMRNSSLFSFHPNEMLITTTSNSQTQMNLIVYLLLSCFLYPVDRVRNSFDIKTKIIQRFLHVCFPIRNHLYFANHSISLDDFSTWESSWFVVCRKCWKTNSFWNFVHLSQQRQRESVLLSVYGTSWRLLVKFLFHLDID